MKRAIIVMVFLAVLICGCATPTDNQSSAIKLYEEKKYEAAIKKFQAAEKARGDETNKFYLGKIYYEQGDYVQAIPYFKETGRLVWLAHAYFYNGQLPAAIETIKLLLDKGPSNMAKVDWQDTVALCQKAGQIEPLIYALKREAAARPNDAALQVELAGLYNKQKNFSEALSTAKTAIKLKPDAIIYNELGIAYGNLGQVKEAIESFEKAIELNPRMVDPHYNLGSFFLKTNDYRKAYSEFKQAGVLDPGSQRYFWQAFALYCLGEYDQALTIINQAIDVQSAVRLGIDFAIKGGYPIITNVFADGLAAVAKTTAGDIIIKIDGYLPRVWTHELVVERVKLAKGKDIVLTVKDANTGVLVERRIARELSFDKKAANSFALRSLIYRMQENLEASNKDADQALALNPESNIAKLAKGLKLIADTDYSAALAVLKDLDLTLNYPSGWQQGKLALATAYLRLGQAQAAIDTYIEISKEALYKNIPTLADRRLFLQEMAPVAQAQKEQADTLKQSGEFQQALKKLAQVLILAANEQEAQEVVGSIFGLVKQMPVPPELPEEARKFMLRSEILVKNNDYAGAINELKEAIKYAPFVSILYFNIAVYQGDLKNYQEAIDYMRLYLEAAPDAPNARAAKDKIIEWELLLEKELR